MPTATRSRSGTRAPGLPLAEAAELFRLLGCGPRLRLLYLLLERGEAHVGALCAALGQTQAAVSSLLAGLRQAGLVKRRREGHRNYYRIDSALLVALLQWGGDRCQSPGGER
jgi:DNA-binding transcriptional ArsR family regulator